MKTKVLSLYVDKSMSFTRFQTRLESSINIFADGNCNFEQFEDIRELFLALQKSLENDELIVTAVDIKNYLKLKSALIQAFETETVCNQAIRNKLELIADLSDKKKKAFSTFPEPATVFESNDGLYSGYILENGSQYLIILPIDNNRIDDILRNGVVPYLNKNVTINSITEKNDNNDSTNFENISQSVENVLKSGLLVAINGTKNAEVLKSCCDFVPGFNKAFVFTPYVQDKGNVNPAEYSAQLARASLDLSSADIGACISDIYSADDSRCICIAIAREDSALVRKLYMSEDETEYEFVKSAATELIQLLGEKATEYERVEEVENNNLITDADKKYVKRKPLAIIAIIIGVAIIICAVIGIIYEVQGEDGQMAKFLSSIFNNVSENLQPVFYLIRKGV